MLHKIPASRRHQHGNNNILSTTFDNYKKYNEALNDILKARSLGLNPDTNYIAKLKVKLK